MNWTDLIELIRNGESSGMEFKRDDISPEQLANARVTVRHDPTAHESRPSPMARGVRRRAYGGRARRGHGSCHRDDPARGGPDGVMASPGSGCPWLRRRQPCAGRSWQVRRLGHARAETPAKPGEARPRSEPGPGTLQAPGLARAAPTPPMRLERAASVRPPTAMTPTPSRAELSKFRTPKGGWRRGSRPRRRSPDGDLRRASGPGRPRCRRRSPIAAVAFQFIEQLG